MYMVGPSESNLKLLMVSHDLLERRSASRLDRGLDSGVGT